MTKTCFIDMPFGKKKDPRTGLNIDFDHIYNEGIKPAVIEAGLECIRGDKERTGGIIHKAMFARLLLSDFVIADMTTANPNVFYELGIRHASKPYTTIPIYAISGDIPFDVNLIRAISYRLNNECLDMSTCEEFKKNLITRIRSALKGPVQDDSPLFQLFNNYKGIEISHELTDVFKEQVQYSEEWKEKFENARSEKSEEIAISKLKFLENELGDLKTVESDIIVDLLLSYRDKSAFTEMVDLYDKISSDVQNAVIVRQQYTLALNRIGKTKKAINVCKKILDEHGGSAETYGILGRIYKDRYKKATEDKELESKFYLQEAIDAYTNGFEKEPMDYYPGINAILLSIEMDTEKANKEIERLIPIVNFSVARRGGMASTNYWDLATTLILAFLTNESKAADEILPRLLVAGEHSWMVETTADDLERIINLWQNKEGKEKITEKIKNAYQILRNKQKKLKGVSCL